MDDSDDRQNRFLEGEKDLAEVDAEIGQLMQQVDFLKVDKKQLEDERKETAKNKAKIELDVKSLSDGQSAAQRAKTQYTSEFERLQNSIKEREDELAEVTPNYSERQQREGITKAELDNAEATRQRLYAKQGRNARFRNKRERDEWLREEINGSYPQLAKIKAVRVQTTEDITQIEKDVANLELESVSLREQLDNRGDSNEAMQKQVEAAKSEKERLMDERK